MYPICLPLAIPVLQAWNGVNNCLNRLVPGGYPLRMRVIYQFLVMTFLIVAVSAQNVRYFPQIGDGEAGAFRFQTSVIFVNAGEAAQATLDFFKDDGTPMEVTLPEFDPQPQSSFQIDLAAGQSVFARTTGTSSPVQVGYARLTAQSGVGATAVFSGTDIASGVLLFEAGVPASSPLSEMSLFLDSKGSQNTGLALVAPADPAPSGGDLSVTVRLLDDQMNVVGTSQFEMAPGTKKSQFVHQFFPSGSAERTKALEMRGTFQVLCKGGSAAAVVLRQLQVTQAFPAVVPTLTTFPVVSGVPNDLKWELVWSDEFNGTTIDATKWTHQIGVGSPAGWGNNELEYYTSRPENSFIQDGKLVIRAIKEVYREGNITRSYTSARMRTINKGDWKYGRIEVLAKMPKGKGIWPAIWMMPTDSVYGGWAASGEIDIVEYLGHQTNKVYGTLHYGGAWPNNKSSGGDYTLPEGTFNDSFHLFTLEWEEGVFRWYVDGELYQTQTEWYTAGQEFPAPFDQRFHLIVNVAVGGNWPGVPDATTQFPQQMEIDYIRVYQKAN